MNQDIIIDEPAQEQLRSISKWTKFIGIAFLFMTALFLFNCLSILFNFEEVIDKTIEEMSKSEDASEGMIMMLSSIKLSDVIIFTVIFTTILFLHGYLLLKLGIFSSPKKINSLPRAFTNLNWYFILSITLGLVVLLLFILLVVFVFSLYLSS